MANPTWLRRLFLALPGVHLLLVAVTVLAPGELIRVLGVDPFVFPFMFSKDSVVISVFLVVGTLWWFAIGYVGWRSSNESGGHTFGWISGVVLLLLSLAGILFSIGMLFLDIREKRLEAVLCIQEFLVALLCSGALASSLFSFRAAARDTSSSSSAIVE
jgi:hypothetical protein